MAELGRLRDAICLCAMGKGVIAVCSDNFGLFAGDGLIGGMIESIASCFRSSDVGGDGSLCEEDAYRSRLCRLGLGSCERMGRASIAVAALKIQASGPRELGRW